MGKRTRVRALLEACGWFSIRELVDIHTTVVMWKMYYLRRPGHLSRTLTWNVDLLVVQEEPRLQFTGRSMTSRGGILWNKLPLELREIRIISPFKRRFKLWTKEQMTLESD